MNDIIFEKHNGETVTVVIDGKAYPREVVDEWTPMDILKIRDGILLRHERESKAYTDAIFTAFRPYLVNAKAKKARADTKRDLAQTIRQMPREDVISVFTDYFSEMPNMTNGDGSKNE